MEKPATKAQLDYIEAIEEWTGIKFNGSTKDEAAQYLDRYSPIYKESMKQLQYENEVTMGAIDAKRDW